MSFKGSKAEIRAHPEEAAGNDQKRPQKVKKKIFRKKPELEGRTRLPQLPLNLLRCILSAQRGKLMPMLRQESAQHEGFGGSEARRPRTVNDVVKW